MKQFARYSLCCLTVAVLLSSVSFAGGKEEAARALMAKSFQQADIWTQGPVKLDAKVRWPGPSGDLNLGYTVSWVSPDKWRTEWTAPNLTNLRVLNNGKLSYVTNQSAPMLRALEFYAALAMLDGGNPAGPYIMPPLDLTKAKLDVEKKKINNAEATCVAFGQPTLTMCFDNATAHLLSVDSELGTFEYSDYVTVGSNSYPQTVKVSYMKTVMEDAKVTVTRGDKFADTLFAAPDKAITTDMPGCADVDKNFTAPHLAKSAPPKMPEAARKAKKYGMVWVLATVGKDGSVSKAVVIGGDPDLNQAATDDVEAYKFTPYMRCGQAVEFEKIVVVPFAPPQKLAEEPSVTK